MNTKNITVELPPGVEVKENKYVGIIYIENDNELPILEHPYDNDSARKLVWIKWLARHPEYRIGLS